VRVRSHTGREMSAHKKLGAHTNVSSKNCFCSYFKHVVEYRWIRVK